MNRTKLTPQDVEEAVQDALQKFPGEDWTPVYEDFLGDDHRGIRYLDFKAGTYKVSRQVFPSTDLDVVYQGTSVEEAARIYSQLS